jgi:hypothetical protein
MLFMALKKIGHLADFHDFSGPYVNTIRVILKKGDKCHEVHEGRSVWGIAHKWARPGSGLQRKALEPLNYSNYTVASRHHQ